MVRVIFNDGVCSRFKIIDPIRVGGIVDEWASGQLLKQVKASLDALYPGVIGLHDDLTELLGRPLKIEWNNQIQMSHKDAMFLQLKYGDLIDHVSD